MMLRFIDDQAERKRVKEECANIGQFAGSTESTTVVNLIDSMLKVYVVELAECAKPDRASELRTCIAQCSALQKVFISGAATDPLL